MAKKKFTEEDVSNAIYHHARSGKPELANKIRILRDAGEKIPGDLINISGVKSEKPVKEKLEIPARNGSTEEWQEFAGKVSDFDEAVLEKMGRDEIIEILEQRKIIPTDDEKTDASSSENDSEDGSEPNKESE